MLQLLIALVLIGQDGKLDARLKELAANTKQAKTAEGLAFVADQYLALAADAVEQDQYDVAQKAAETAARLATGAKNAELAAKANARAADAKTKGAEYAKTRSFYKVLEGNPDDGPAHVAVGKFLCFVKGEWEKGLPHFSKGSDEGLRKLASKEELFAGPGEMAVESRLEIADDWWPKSKDRAVYWYKRAWPNLNPLQKEKIRNQFREVYGKGVPAVKDVPPTGWFVDQGGKGPVGADEFYAASGKRSLRLGGGKYPPVVQNGLPTGGAKECVLTFRVLTEGGAAEIRPVLVQFWTKDSKEPRSNQAIAVPGDEPWWHEVTMKIAVPAGATHGRVYFEAPSETCRVWLDAVSLKTAAGAELVVNGDFEN